MGNAVNLLLLLVALAFVAGCEGASSTIDNFRLLPRYVGDCSRDGPAFAGKGGKSGKGGKGGKAAGRLAEKAKVGGGAEGPALVFPDFNAHRVGRRTHKITGNVTVLRPIPAPLTVTVEGQHCSSATAPDTCRVVLQTSLPEICPRLNDSTAVWYDFLSHVEFLKLKCPIEPGTYRLPDYLLQEEDLRAYFPFEGFWKYRLGLAKLQPMGELDGCLDLEIDMVVDERPE